VSSDGLLTPSLTPEQTMLSDASERFIKDACPLDAVRRWMDEPDPLPPSYFEKSAPLGWYGLLAPEALGGGAVSDSPLADAVVVARQRGATLQPGAFIGQNVVTHVLGAEKPGSELAAVARRLVDGSARASWALADATGDWSPGRSIRAESDGRSVVLTGRAGLVQDAHRVDWLLVAAETESGLGQCLVPTDAPGLVVTPLESLDLTKRFSTVHFEGVRVEGDRMVGDPAKAAARIEEQFQRALILQVAESLGAMDALLRRTVAYAQDRIAFGRPIGSFQAIKHVLADQSLRVEGTRAVLAGAVEAVEGGACDAPSIASITKAYAGDTGVELSQSCLQIHGGIGFTWEHDLHLYLRRLTSDAALFGDPTWHRERLADLHAK